MNEHIQFLYRYRHLNGEHREWTKKIITDSILYFADPPSFNDPFDCRIHYIPSFSKSRLKQQYMKQMKKRITGLNRKQRRAKAIQDISAMKPDKFPSLISQGLQKEVDRVGVLSLSASERNILLWSHYAAGHTGLCLKFIATNQTPFFGRALPVDYVPTYPEISVTTPPDEQMDAFLLTKAEDWKYEEEYRIIDHDHGPGEKLFPPELLAGVILGARMAPDDKKDVTGWVSELRHQVELFEASVASGSFSLEIRPYEG